MLLKRPSLWFFEVTDTRDDLIHYYDSLLISIERGEGGKNVLGHFNIKGRAHRECVNIREHFGFLLCEYQTFIDNLLDYFDSISYIDINIRYLIMIILRRLKWY